MAFQRPSKVCSGRAVVQLMVPENLPPLVPENLRPPEEEVTHDGIDGMARRTVQAEEMLPLKKPRRQWRDYRTRSGSRPVKAFLDDLTDDEVAAVVAGMKEVAERGLLAARHLRGDVYEVRADAATRSFRVLFATEGRYSQVLLSLSAFEKRTQKTPPRELELAEDRLRDWRERGAAGKRAKRPRS